MHKQEQDEKTIILSVIPEQSPETTALVYKPHKLISKKADTKEHNPHILMILIIMAVVFSAVALCVYVLYEQRNQRFLTDKLIGLLHQGSLDQAQEIMSEIRKHRYTSNSIDVLEKKLTTMKELSDNWNRVQQYYIQGMYQEAKNALAQFTSNTSYRDRALVLLENIKAKELNDVLKFAKSLYAAGNKYKALELVQQVIEADPSNHDAKALLVMMTPKAPVRKQRMRAIKNKNPIGNTGDTAYRKGDYDTAIRVWSDTNTKEDSKKIVIATNIKKYTNIGKKALDSGNYPLAIKCFNKVQAFIDLLGIHDSINQHTARKYLSMSYGSLGKRAITNGSYKQANIYFQESLKFDPLNAEATSGISILKKEAEKLYKTGYMISNANISEACRLYNQALNIAPKDTDVYKKIQERIIICKP